ncbi:unnamed protein product [Ectocarpus fasciculatus]
MQQLGVSTGGAALTVQKKKKKDKGLVEAPVEPVVVAPVSKSMQRKLDALKRRKENEAKRVQYLGEIDKHKLSQEHQELMVSARDQGQKNTTKWRLKMIIRRHKAGLDLSEGDRELLVPYLESQVDLSSDDDAASGLAATKRRKGDTGAPMAAVRWSQPATEPQSHAEQDMDIVCASTSSPVAVKAVSVSAPEPTLAAPVDDGMTVGERLMAQFNQIKTKITEENENRVPELVPIKDYDYSAEFAAHREPSLATDMPSAMDRLMEIQKGNFKPSAPSAGTATSSDKKRFFVNRLDEVQLARMKLPVCGMEQEIVEAINNNDAVILCGETGSGKSTQVPQFLYEAGYCGEEGIKIAITQPRRVAASSTAMRKKKKKKLAAGLTKQLVGYQVRHDASTMTPDTCIKYMTDGILLREVTSDLLLRQYSVIILDEAHERNVNTDVLLGLLSRALILRRTQAENEQAAYDKLPEDQREGYMTPIKPLKLVIMSATLRINDFLNTRLFPPPMPYPPVEARQYPVVPHFAKKTELHNYTKMAYKKVVQIHKKLPDGGILVFLTGKREIMQMTNKLRRYFARRNIAAVVNVADDAPAMEEDEAVTKGRRASRGGRKSSGGSASRKSRAEDYSSEGSYDSASSAGESDDFTSDEGSGDEQDTRPEKKVESPEDDEERPKNALVLPLFAMLSAEQQARVFDPPPPGCRLIVIATNVAETSITIPGVKYVVDCGRYKEKVIKSASGISKFEVQWVSKASADQRMGRAGRTGPGHCYRLFSSAFYDQHMKEFQAPEILKTPLEDLLLQMRTLGIEDVESFPFPTPPTAHAIRIALSSLSYIAAVSAPNPASDNMLSVKPTAKRLVHKITALGKMLAKFPISARYAKMLVVAHRSTGLSPTLVCALVAALTERPPFISRRNNFSLVGDKRKNDSESNDSDAHSEEDEKDDSPPLSFHPTSDAIARLRALGAYIHARNQAEAGFCSKHFLHQPSLERSLDLSSQLCGLYSDILGSGDADTEAEPMGMLQPPNAEEELALRQILMTGLPDCVARRAKAGVITTGSRKHRLTAYFSCNPSVTKPLYIHPESCLYRKDPTANLPEYVVYGQLVENEMGTATYMTSVSAIEASWLPELARDCPLLKYSDPLQTPLPTYDHTSDEIRCYVVPSYGVHNWELSPVRTSLASACVGLNSSGAVDEAVRWFARLLLEGSVLDDATLRGVFVKSHIKLTLSTLTAQKVTKTGSQLLLKLAKARISSVSALKEKLKEMPLFLYEELQACLHMEARKQFRQQWTRFVQSL